MRYRNMSLGSLSFCSRLVLIAACSPTITHAARLQFCSLKVLHRVLQTRNVQCCNSTDVWHTSDLRLAEQHNWNADILQTYRFADLLILDLSRAHLFTVMLTLHTCSCKPTDLKLCIATDLQICRPVDLQTYRSHGLHICRVADL